MRTSGVPIVVLVALGCGASPYGYAQYYEPLGEEEAFEDAPEPVYTDVVRDPAAFSDRVIGWFGVVSEVVSQDGGGTLVRMSQRVHQERHLCSGRSEDTCRVTISERDSGPFSARIVLRSGSDTEGTNRVQQGSLIKVYGRVTGDYDTDGGPILEADYYRHWPRGQYLDTSARALMPR